MKKRPIYAIAAGALAAVLALGGCATGDGGSGAGSDQTLRIQAGEPVGLDPAVTVTQRSLRAMELIYDTLVDYDADNQLVPALAESWEVSEDGLSYVFTLRDAKFSDGSAITAADVVFSLERARTSETMANTFAVVESIEETGDKEVTVTLTEPSRVFLNAIAAVGQSVILSQAAVEGDPDYFTSPTVTSGPWTIESYTPKSGAKFVANEHYWNTGFPIIQTIEYTFNDDNTAMATGLETDTIDFAFNMKPADAVRLSDAGTAQYFEAPSAGLLSWSFDKTKAPFDNVDVRQAVAYLVPREDRLQTCWEGIGAVSFGDQIFPGQDFHTQGPDPYDVSKEEALATAIELLEGAGWVEGADGVRVSQGVAGLADGTPLAVNVPYENSWAQARCNTEMLQQSLAPAGIAITPEAYDPAQFWGDAADGKFTFWHGGNSYATVDIFFAQTFLCDGSVNALITRWCNDEVDALIKQAQATSDLDEAAELYRQVQDIIIEEAPFITTGGQFAVIGASTKLTDYYPRADASNRGLIYASLAE